MAGGVRAGAIDPATLRSAIKLPDGSTLARYFQTLPDGTQAWAEVPNGVEVTIGGQCHPPMRMKPPSAG